MPQSKQTFDCQTFAAARVTGLGEIVAIRRFFIVGHFFENFRRSTNFWATFSTYSILTKNGLGDFFTNTSGHPGHPGHHMSPRPFSVEEDKLTKIY
jgi:hypothetical protein